MRKAQQTEGSTYPPMPYPHMSYSPQIPSQTETANYGNTNSDVYDYFSPPEAQPMSHNAPPQQFNVIPTQIFQNPMVTNMAMQYGQNVVEQSKEVIDRELNKYISASRVKYYFSVDNKYVLKKLGLLLFPFSHRNWGVKYNPAEPLQPRYELNAPDLYIPVMAFVSFVLTSGISLGLREHFSPEVLGILSSSVIIWALMEVLVIWLTLYVLNIQTPLKVLDLLAFSSYKYVGMIASILVSFVAPWAYKGALIYFSFAIVYFLIRSLRARILIDSSSTVNLYGSDETESTATGNFGMKRRSYLLLFIAALQPLLMWWMTRNLAHRSIIKSI